MEKAGQGETNGKMQDSTAKVARKLNLQQEDNEKEYESASNREENTTSRNSKSPFIPSLEDITLNGSPRASEQHNHGSATRLPKLAGNVSPTTALSFTHTAIAQ